MTLLRGVLRGITRLWVTQRRRLRFIGRLWLGALSKCWKGNQDRKQTHRQAEKGMQATVVRGRVSSWHDETGKGTT